MDSETPKEPAPMPRPPRSKFSQFMHQHVKPFVFIVLILCTFRSSIADWNDVPSGSMNPSILEGDRIFVNKLAYDLKVPFTTWHVVEWGQPKRGDIVVFYSPVDGIRLVKRVIGLPGDTLELKDNRLFINGMPASYGDLDPKFAAAMAGRVGGTFSSETFDGRSHPMLEAIGLLGHPDYGPTVVPAGKFFMMGDNRNNSNDSRYWGFVDRNLVVGRALAVAISFDPDHSYFPRWRRFFSRLP